MSSSENLSSGANAATQQQQQAAPGGGQEKESADFRKNFNYPLVKYTDMNDEIRAEVVDMVVGVVEKFASNYETAAKTIKESMDKKLGTNWHVVLGEGFAFEITHEMRNLLYMFTGGSVGILIWKAS